MGRLHEEPLPPGVPPVTFAPREPRLRRPPFLMIALFLTLVIASWVPLVLFARGRVSKTDEPRVHLVQDMGTQPKYREQQTSTLFADGRAARPRVAGTVARGTLQEDDHYFRGYKSEPGADGKAKVTFVEGMPKQVQMNEALVRRGQQRYEIYCAPCHGVDGYGNGPVHIRATEAQESKWVQPASLHADAIRARPDGHIYNTINVGIRNMNGYGSQIDVPDRWAIVAYVRALQLSQHAAPAVASQGNQTSTGNAR